MFIGEVIGTVVASHKTETMDGLPLRIIRRVNADGEASDQYVVAVDVVGAANGEYVLVTAGSAARQTRATDNRPIDAIAFAIVDTWQTEHRVRYDKSTSA